MAKGVSIYITDAEIDALLEAQSYLSALLEAATETDQLIKTKQGLANIEDKISKAHKSAAYRERVKACLRAAQDK